MTITPVPGDVWAVRTSGAAARLIRFGTALRYLFGGGDNLSDLDNHVVIVTHQTAGVWFGVEGRPGGVGWADLTRYLNDPTTISNAAQPKTDAQRAAIVALVPEVLGTPYDWSAIMRSAAADLHIPELFQRNWNDKGIPGHVICSALADWMNEHVGLASPKPDQDCQPSDWVAFIDRKDWL